MMSTPHSFRRPLIICAAIFGIAQLSALPVSARHMRQSNRAPAAAPTRAALGSPAPRLVQAYLLGIADYSASAAVERLDAAIRSGHKSVQQMRADAEQTRSGEEAAYRAAFAQLKSMHAPTPVIAPYQPAIEALEKPVTVTASAQAQVPDDLNAQQVWSTLDEADRIAPSGSGILTSWLKLSRGRDALWAYHVGNLSAVIRAEIPGDASRLPLIHGAGALAESAPIGCPRALVDALKTIAGQANENKVTGATLESLNAAIENVFGPGLSPLSAFSAPPRTSAAATPIHSTIGG